MKANFLDINATNISTVNAGNLGNKFQKITSGIIPSIVPKLMKNFIPVAVPALLLVDVHLLEQH